jgi:hypothetical protein
MSCEQSRLLSGLHVTFVESEEPEFVESGALEVQHSSPWKLLESSAMTQYQLSSTLWNLFCFQVFQLDFPWRFFGGGF